jgi:hypothetical protein
MGSRRTALRCFAGPAHQLTGIDRADPQDLRDLRVGVDERLTQDVRRPLGGGEPFEQQQEGEFERFAPFGTR